MYLFVVLIVGLIALIVFSFLFGSVIENVQRSFNNYLGVDKWVTSDHFNMFYLAASFVTNIWTYIYAFAFFGMLFFAYLYSQRRGVAQ